MSRVAEVGTDLLGSSAVSAAARAVTGRKLRVLAYHGVPDRSAFERQVGHVAEAYRPVDGAEVAAALSGGAALPDRAVWLTFDDGRPDVVEHALPVLQRHGMTATLFVVAGVVDTTEPFWWEVVERALAAGVVTDRSTVPRLKRTADVERRAEVGDLRDKLRADGIELSTRQLTTQDLRTWLDAGGEVGNHSWDHPCLDTCPAGAQADQVRRAHEALAAVTGAAPTAFAYPNGNFSDPVDVELRRLGYRVGLLFDHRLATMADATDRPLQVSRLRVDAAADLPRFRAIVSGAHSGLFHAQRRTRALVRR